MIDTILNHRSIRKYKSADVSKELLDEILNAGIRASNTGNMQLYSVVVTRDASNKQKLAPAHFNQPMITNAPVVLTFCADVNRFVLWAKQRKADVGFDNFESFISAVVDTCLFAQNVSLAAEARGLGICYLGTTTYNTDKIIEALNLPAGVIPVTTVTLGFPDEQPELTSRLPLTAVVHDEQYRDYTPETIDKIYSSLESDPANQKFVVENNKDNLAQVFAEVRYSKANNEYFSKVYKDALVRQGLM